MTWRNRGDTIGLAWALMIICVVLLLLSLSSCAPVKAVQTAGPSGAVAYAMRCSGMGRTVADCLTKARDLCGGEFEIVHASSSPVGVPTSSGVLIAPRETIVVECR